jgi:uncharacterized membrane protein
MLSARSPWLAPALLGCLALAVRLLNLDHVARTDELYHYLAAQSWLAEGQLRVADGTYDRTPLFTILIAKLFGLFGESMVVARLPSVITGTALVVAVFLWTRSVAGSLAAVIAALLLALDPEAIEISQFLRFYALHGLLFWLGSIAVYQLVTAPPPTLGRTLLLAAGAVLCLYAARYLQVTTLIGLVGLAAWAVLALGLPWLARSSPRMRWSIVAATTLAAVAAVAILTEIGVVGQYFAYYRSAGPYGPESRDAVWFYHYFLTIYYPILWPLVTLAVVVGLAYRPRPTAFCASVAGVALVLHSLGGAKEMRYVYYTTPFLFVLWAIALAEIWPRLRPFLEDIGTRTLGWLRLGRLGRPGMYAVLGVALLFTIAANGAFVRTTATMFDVIIPPAQRPADWASARQVLAPWVADAAIVVTASELETLYHLGRYEVLISKGRLSEIADRREFDLDPRTGRPVIAAPQSLALLMDCYPSGLIVATDDRWRNPVQVDDAVANLIEARAEEFDVPGFGMRAYVWRQPEDARRAEACAQLPTGLRGEAMTALGHAS